MLTVRPATKDDSPYVLDSFVEEFKGSVYSDGMTRTQVRKLLTGLDMTRWSLVVLCESDTPDEIIAWLLVAVKGAREVAWVHCKGIYRRKGFATRLLREMGIDKGKVKTPFIPSPKFARLARQHGWNLLHRPWMGMT